MVLPESVLKVKGYVMVGVLADEGGMPTGMPFYLGHLLHCLSLGNAHMFAEFETPLMSDADSVLGYVEVGAALRWREADQRMMSLASGARKGLDE